MKACVLEAVGELQYKDIEKPKVKKGEVLLEIKASGICSSDVDRVFKTGTYHFPTIPGHEFSGKIVEIGEDVSESYLNKKAVVFPLIPCKKCAACDIGEYARCENYNYYGSRCDGGFAEYIAVSVWNVILCPDDIPYSIAALCEPASVALHAISRVAITPHDVVTIVGNGTVGMLGALWAQKQGAKKVIVVGNGQEKIEYLHSCGFTNVYNSEDAIKCIEECTDGRGADVVYEFVGNSKALEFSINAVKKGGSVVLVGNPNGNMDIERNVYWKILRGELNIVGSWNSSYNANRNDWKTTIDALAGKEINPEKLITHKFKLEESKKAFDVLKDKNNLSLKVMFVTENIRRD